MIGKINNTKLLCFLICIVTFVIIYTYLIKCSDEPFNNIYQPIKGLEKSKNNSLIPYLEQIRNIKYPKINCYEQKNNNKLVFNKSNNQNRRNLDLNKLNTNYFNIENDTINQLLLPKNDELFMI